jgi:hypothetical protein
MFNQKGAWLFPMLDGGLRGKAAFLGRSHLSPDGGGFTRAAVHRLAADVYDSTAGDSGSSAVATCRQTVEALLAPLSTAWQRMSTIRQRTIRFFGRSHLSPDGGSFTRAASTAWQRMSTIRQPAIQVPRT